MSDLSNIAAFGRIPPGLDTETQRYILALTESIRSLNSNIGVIKVLAQNPVVAATQGSSGTIAPGGGTITITQPPQDLTPPPIPTGLSATGALFNIIVQWTPPTFPNFDHTEIWSSSTNSIGTAVLTGAAEASLWADAVGFTGAVRFYWIRFIKRVTNIDGTHIDIAGPFTVTGVVGTTGLIGATNIAAAQITHALIGLLAVDDGNIANLNAVKITAGDIAAARMVTNFLTAAQATITTLSAITASVGVLTAGVIYGFPIDGSKYINLSNDGTTGTRFISTPNFWVDGAGNASFAGDISGSNGTFSGTLTAANIITTANMQGGSVTTPIVAANAVSNTYSVYDNTATTVAQGAGFITVVTLSFTTPTAGDLVINGNVYVETGPSSSAFSQVQVLVDSVQQFIHTLPALFFDVPTGGGGGE